MTHERWNYMTREQALMELEGTWMFREVDGMIALRDVTLIEAVKTHERELSFQQRDLVSDVSVLQAWPTL